MGLDMSLQRCDPDGNLVMTINWRKFNALHHWFHKLVGGLDNCRVIEVAHADLVTLRDSLRYGLVQHSPVLEPMAGFFFGPIAVDNKYWENMLDTWEDLNRMLDSVELGTKYYYFADW